MKYKQILNYLIPFLLLTAGLYLVPLNIFGYDLSKIPGDLGDARFNNYILEHGYRYMRGDIPSFWNGPFMYPFQNVIALSDNLLGTMPLYALLRSFGFDRETAFQLWFIALFVLNFICCYWALVRWSGSVVLSATGAYIFTFSIFILGHIYNVQVFPRFMVPLVLYWTWKYFSEKQVKYFLFLSLGIVYQFYCGIYLGFMLIYVLMFLIVACLLFYRDKSFFLQFKNTKILLRHIGIAVLSIIILAPLMLPYLEISHKMGMRSFDEAFFTIPTLRSYFFTTSAPVLWNALSTHAIDKLPYWWCHFLFTGALPWVGIFSIPFFLFSKKIDTSKKKFLLFLTLALFLCFVFSLNINGFSLYRYIFMLPGFSSMRAINRIINTEILLFIIILVYSFLELSNRYVLVKYIVFMFPLLIIVDNLINPNEVKRFEKTDSQKRIALVSRHIQEQYNKNYTAIAYTVTSLPGTEVETNLNVMLASQELGIPCVNAYTGSYPETFYPLLGDIDNNKLQVWCKENGIDEKRIQSINDFGVAETGHKKVKLKTANGLFISSDGSVGNQILSNKPNGYAWETFTMIMLQNNQFLLRDYKNHFLSAEIDRTGEITATREKAGTWETFNLIQLEGKMVALQAVNGKYFGLDPKTSKIFAVSDSIGINERFELIAD